LGARDPFFSPTGEWVAFFADDKLKKVALTGSAPITLADAANPRGGAWSAEDDSIVFQPINAAGVNVGALMRVPASGGTAMRLIPLSDGEVTQRWPQVLPGGAVLFTSHTTTTSGYADASIVVQRIRSGERKVLVRGGYFAGYVPTGHLVYVHEGRMLAAPFDVERLELRGQAVPVVEGIATSESFGGAQFSIGGNGTWCTCPAGSRHVNRIPRR
jgi:serine/threonine-protein kinase